VSDAARTVAGTWQHLVGEQSAFAELSGDANPLHVDPIAARRYQFGGAVVHGVNLVLRDLEIGLAAIDGRATPLRFARVHARFRRPVLAGSFVTYARTPTGPTGWRTAVEQDGRLRAEIVVDLAAMPDRIARSPLIAAPPGACVELAPHDIAGAHGSLALRLDDRRLAALFPVVEETVPEVQVAQLLATTRLVGMECPGLHSVYRELALVFDDATGTSDLRWEVTRFDARFGLAQIGVTGDGVTGTVEAAVRPRPAVQAPMAEVRSLVDPVEFADQRAVVVGGSRGLGELTARILAAGGAAVTVTYRVGRDDADHVVAALGPPATLRQVDVTAPVDELAASLADVEATHLYYFATPPIPSGGTGGFDQAAFDEMARVYVAGLWALVFALRSSAGGVPTTVFSPSSVYVERPPRGLAEYAAAKAAGEGASRALESEFPGIRVSTPRLPPMVTDQTAGVAALGPSESLRLVLDAVREAVARS
jgi:NAD(P)-dependent dehydrogenase (short-subunit alcohol dehydrogenase family)/acyl dehydratase